MGEPIRKVKDTPCCNFKEKSYRTGEEIEYWPQGWVAKVAWVSSRNNMVFGVFVQQNFQLQQGGGAMSYPYWTNWKLQSGRKTDVSCLCNPDLVGKYGAGFITYLQFNARDGAFYSDDNPNTQDIDLSKRASWISGLIYEKDPKKPIVNTPYGPLTPILISDPLEWSGNRELVPFNGTGIEAYLGPVQALKTIEKVAIKTRNEGISRAITSEDDGCSGKAIWRPDHKRGIYTYYCEFKTFSEVQVMDGKSMEVAISQRDADRYWCGSVWEGQTRYFNLCKQGGLVPPRLTKCHDLQIQEEEVKLVWKGSRTVAGQVSIRNLIGVEGTDAYDRLLEKPEIYAAAAIESVEFHYCGCKKCEIACYDKSGDICCVNCGEVGQKVIDALG